MKILIKSLWQSEFNTIWQAMRDFTHQRNAQTLDEIWLVEHLPVYTLGQAAKKEHILNSGGIPVVYTDRGGQVTYHGPGQLVIYPLLDLRRFKLTVRGLVTLLENSVIEFLASHSIKAHSRPTAPGVYVNEAKIASIGLRIRQGFSYHGLAFNIAMDLAPFLGINPCGFKELAITQLADLGGPNDLYEVAKNLSQRLVKKLLTKNSII